MVSWDPDLPYDAETQRIKRERDADAIEVPEPYTEAEWAETEGARARYATTGQPLVPRYGGLNVDPAPFIDGWYNRDPE